MEYENFRRVQYEEVEGGGTPVFIPVCEKCGRFVKADQTVEINYDGLKNQPNATCRKCGRIEMVFEGFF